MVFFIPSEPVHQKSRIAPIDNNEITAREYERFLPRSGQFDATLFDSLENCRPVVWVKGTPNPATDSSNVEHMSSAGFTVSPHKCQRFLYFLWKVMLDGFQPIVQYEVGSVFRLGIGHEDAKAGPRSPLR